MNVTEDFKSIGDFKSFHKNIMDSCIKVDEYIHFAIAYSNHYPGGDPIQDIRDAYENNTEPLINLFRIKVCSAYLTFVTGNNFDLATNFTEDAIKNGLISLLTGDEPGTLAMYDTYIYPYSRVKFTSEFFNNISPLYSKRYQNLLANNSYVSFKKSYTLMWDIPYSETFITQFESVSNTSYKDLDINQIIKDLYDTINFYKDQYSELEEENKNLTKLIDSLSQQVTNQSLTRWY